MIVIGLLLALAGSSDVCRPVEGMRILGRHLAAADAAFSGLAPDAFVGYAPSPGVRRVFGAVELERIARAHGVELKAPGELCFEWPMAALDPERMIEAMRRNPGLGEAKIEITESDRLPAPHGEIVFPPGGHIVSAGSPDGIMWRGYVKYDATRRFTIWAKVKISVACTRIVATRSLPIGEPIREEDLRMESFQGLSEPHGAVMRVEEIIGQTPRRPIRSGEVIVRNLLEPSKDVRKGDSVDVTVSERNLRFRVEGYAETAGRRGDTILVRNITSGRRFRARVDGPGRVTVLHTAPQPEAKSE